MAHYVDTSALVKLVVAEVETGALPEWLTVEEREPVTSDVARTELMRAVRLRGGADQLVDARRVINAIAVTQLRTEVFESVAFLEPPALRPLDALHLAAALDLGDSLSGIVTYDDRLGQAARLHGISVVAPA